MIRPLWPETIPAEETMHSDPIADMLTRIRNAAAIAAAARRRPASKFKRSLAQLLVREGYLKSVEDATNEATVTPCCASA
jgi:small subunit ribosomal protein S8